MTTKVITIAKFSGEPKDYPEFKRDVENKARTASALHENGLLGLIMTEENYKDFTTTASCKNGLKFTPLPETDQSKSDELQGFVMWEYHAKKKTAETVDILAMKTAVEEALDEVSKRRMSDPKYGMAKLTIADIMEWMEKRFGKPTAQTLKDNLELMNTIRVENGTSSMDKYLSTFHEEPYKVAKQNGNDIAKSTRIMSLMDGIAQCGVYSGAVDQYLFAYPTPETQEFDKLAELLRAQDARATRKTSGGSGMVNQVTENAPPLSLQSINEKLDSFMSAFTALTAAAALQQQQVPQSQHQQTRAPRPDTRPDTHYCWTHGPNASHNGDAPCKFPRPGHQPTATAANKMGGAQARVPRSARK